MSDQPRTQHSARPPPPPHMHSPHPTHIHSPPASATFHLFFLSLLATRSKMKRQPDKRKQRNHSSIGCEHKNFLLAAASFSGSFCLRNYILFHMFRDKTIFLSFVLLPLQTLALTETKSPPRVSGITGVDCSLNLRPEKVIKSLAGLDLC